MRERHGVGQGTKELTPGLTGLMSILSDSEGRALAGNSNKQEAVTPRAINREVWVTFQIMTPNHLFGDRRGLRGRRLSLSHDEVKPLAPQHMSGSSKNQEQHLSLSPQLSHLPLYPETPPEEGFILPLKYNSLA